MSDSSDSDSDHFYNNHITNKFKTIHELQSNRSSIINGFSTNLISDIREIGNASSSRSNSLISAIEKVDCHSDWELQSKVSFRSKISNPNFPSKKHPDTCVFLQFKNADEYSIYSDT